MKFYAMEQKIDRIQGVALKWFQTYLENREQKVEITYRCRETKESIYCLSRSHGVPQGSVLG
jgi:hypothetical protein